MKLRKVILLFLVILLCVSMLFSCGSPNPVDSDSDVVSTGKNNSNISSDNDDVIDENGILEISVAMPDIAQNFNVEDPDEMLQYVQDKFKVKFIPYNVGWGDFQEKLGVAAASDDLPDVFMHGIRGTQTYLDWVDQDVIRPWPTDFNDFPNTKANVESPEFQGYWENGEVYFLPKFSYQIPEWWAMDKAIYARKDWMDNLGIDDPKSNEEFIDMLIAFTKNDPDGNGVDDTYGLAPYSTAHLMGLLYFQYLPNNYGRDWGGYVKDSDTGLYSIYMTQPEAFEALKFLRELWQEGVLDPDFPTYKDQDAAAVFATGRVGALAYSAPPDHIRLSFDAWTQVNPDKDFFDHVKVIYPWQGADGKMYRNLVAAANETLLNSKTSDEKALRYLEIHEWLLSDEGTLFSTLGLEGVSYKKAGEGIYESLLGNRDSGDPVRPMEVYPSLGCFNFMASWSGAHAQFFNPENPKEMVKMSEDYRDYMINNGEAPEIDYDIYTLVCPEMASLAIDYWSEAMEFILASSEKSDEDAWDELQQRLKDAGLDDGLEALNALAKEKGILE